MAHRPVGHRRPARFWPRGCLDPELLRLTGRGAAQVLGWASEEAPTIRCGGGSRSEEARGAK
eukprot:15461950-Alexandrium_andersonii.AAC.1